MGRITILDENMVNMIAAGEVIERPASVVKELMENSIDAGATRITVSVEDGGKKLIAVTDDGCGMDAEDLVRAFEPHATSKIRTSADLRGISTLGFRGEALASIASVAQVQAVSRTKESTSGYRIEVDCGRQGEVSPCSGDYGTTISVRDLFYKLPARRKFLKTANTEMSHICEQFTRIALTNTTLDLRLVHNGREVYRLIKGQTIKDRIAELFSAEIASGLIETESSEKNLHIYALLGKPDIARTNNKLQFVYINGRFIRDKFISHAIKEAYRGKIDQSRFPVVFLFIKMPYEDYDVNVHPTKIEVRFYNANLVHSQILGCLREKLLGTDLDVTAVPAATEQTSEKIRQAMAEFFKRHRPAQSQRHFSFGDDRQVRSHEGLEAQSRGAQVQLGGATALLAERKFLQLHDSFIVVQTADGFVVIDQHALHERIVYEDLRRRIASGRLESQKLLIPESFQVSESERELLRTYSGVLDKLGIEVVPFGPKTIAVQSFPALLGKTEPGRFVRDLIDLLAEKGKRLDADSLLDEVLNMAACKAAIKAGQRLSDSEIEQLLADKSIVEGTSHCPHGRPTTIKFSIADLEKLFKRT